MQLQEAIKNVFDQIRDSLNALTKEQYQMPSKTLFNATIGQHVRHIIELYVCLFDGYEGGIVNYEKRKRDSKIETDKDFANDLMQMITNNLAKPNKNLSLETGYDKNSLELFSTDTNYERELVYNLEHTVHHMALIRVGINEVSSIKIPETFGVAASTIKYRNLCVQ